MPDASASRKRQIQITLRPFKGAAVASISLTAACTRLRRASFGIGGLEDAQTAALDATRTVPVGFSAVLAAYDVRKSREIDAMPPASQIRSRANHRFRVVCEASGFAIPCAHCENEQASRHFSAIWVPCGVRSAGSRQPVRRPFAASTDSILCA